MKHLAWDSSFFGMKVFSLNTTEDSFEEDLALLRKQAPDLVYCITEQDPGEASTLEKSGCILYDRKAIFKKTEPKHTALSENGIIVVSAFQLTPELEQLAYQSGIYSRFNLDPNLKSRYKALYREWISKSLSRDLADEVIVAKNASNEILGFITGKVTGNTGTIGLLAVAERARGRGLGKLLLTAAENFCYTSGARSIEIITQLDNLPACALYERQGYQLENVKNIYHLYL